jgi:C-terminal processing protease CtpA/Prc
MKILFGHVSLLAMILVIWLAPAAPAPAQRDATIGDTPIELAIDGTVQRVFLSNVRFDATRLVEILLRGVALKDAQAPIQHVRIPPPGDVLFIVINEPSDNRRLQGGTDASGVPQAGDTIRATVRYAGRGVWSATGPDWFEGIGSEGRQAERDIARDGDAGSSDQLIDLRGMHCKAKIVRGQLGLEVSQVESEGPAHDAGFQVGDVIVAVGGNAISSTTKVQQLALEPQPLELSVIDVNSGRLAFVALPASRTGRIEPSRTDDAGPEADVDAAARIASGIGISVEAARAGLRGAVKVLTVDRGKPGAEAGLEPGDVIVAVNRTRVSNADEFAQALPPQGGPVTLVVRDVRSGNEVPIQVRAASVRPVPRDTEQPAETQASPSGETDRLGMSTELSFYDAEAAVKVVAVRPGSPASRAGIRPGWMILKANDAPVLHPDDLTKAEEEAGGRLSLLVVDPSNDRQFTISLER